MALEAKVKAVSNVTTCCVMADVKIPEMRRALASHNIGLDIRCVSTHSP